MTGDAIFLFLLCALALGHVLRITFNSVAMSCIQTFPNRILPGVCLHVHVLCMTLFCILMLTVGHDNTPRCMCVLCLTLFRVLILTVGHDSLTCVCVCYHATSYVPLKSQVRSCKVPYGV